MPSEPFTNEETGERGRFFSIRGERRFIPDDPLDAPGADVFLPGPTQRGPLFGGAVGASLIGFGETLSNTGLRASAALDTIAGREGTEAQTEFAEVKSLLRPLEQQHPFATAVGQSVPGFLLPASKAVQTAGGVAEGLLADPDNPFLSAAIGGAAGFVGGALGEKLGRAVLARGTGAAARLAGRNIPTTLFQRTGSETEKGIEAGLEAIPIISRWARAPLKAQQTALNRGAASVFGFEGTLNREGLGIIRRGIGKSFQQVEAAIPDQQLDKVLISRLDELGALDDATKELLQTTGGVIDGEGMMAIRSALNDDMADAFINANRKEGRRLRSSLNEVDELITARMPPELVEQWSTARKQWQFMTAISKGRAITGEGNVNLATMRNNLDKVYPNFRFGADLPATAQGFGELVQALDELPKHLQSSGSGERVLAAAALTGAASLEPTAGVVPILAAARAAGQPGTGVGGTLGRIVARDVEITEPDDSDSDAQ